MCHPPLNYILDTLKPVHTTSHHSYAATSSQHNTNSLRFELENNTAQRRKTKKGKMSSEALDKRFKDLQDRLVALQDATGQLRELIDRLASFNFQPGSVPLTGTNAEANDGGEDENVVSELGTEINQILREQEEDLELLQEEIADVQPVKKAVSTAAAAADNNAHDEERLKDAVDRLGQELRR